MLTSRDISVLVAIATYYELSRQQIQRLCFPHDSNGRTTRRRLQQLVSAGYVNRHKLFVLNDVVGGPAPVYYPTLKCAQFLAEQFGDERFLRINTDCPQPHLLHHWLAISNTHIALDQAIGRQDSVHLDSWFNEWEVVNKEESAPEKRFRIYQLIRSSPRLVCAPDAAFCLSKDGYRKGFLLEQDRNTTGVERALASKTPGYAAIADQNLHLRIFPGANVPGFTVLMIAPTSRRRDALRSVMRAREFPGKALWRFAAQQDLTPENFLFAPVFHPCEGKPVSLIKPSTGTHDAAEQVSTTPSETQATYQ